MFADWEMPFNGAPDIQMKETEGGDRMNMAGKTNEDLKNLEIMRSGM